MHEDPSVYFYAELHAALQSRAIVPPLPASIRPWQTIFLRTGSLTIDLLDQGATPAQQSITAPALICWSANNGFQFRFAAGSTGVHLALGETFLFSVLGKRPEAIEMRDAVLNFVTLSLDGKHEVARRIEVILNEIALEQGKRSAGQLLVIEAQLRCLLVHLWRHAQNTDEAVGAAGQRTIILRKFRHLVEVNFQSRWRVRDYAEALNITTDRLHDAAKRALGKTPIELIHERTHREAKAVLVRSNLSLDQIAVQLNFNSTQQFSAFFRKMEGIPPAKFRKTNAAAAGERSLSLSLDFSDWP